MNTKRKIQIGKKEILNAIRENAGKFKKSELLAAINENEEESPIEEPAPAPAEEPAQTGGDSLEKFIGGEEDRVISYPDPATAGIEAPMDATGDKPEEFTGGVDGADGAALAAKMSKSAPSQLLDYLEKLEEAKSILSKVAAGEQDQEVKSKIYSHYEKVQKTAFEMIKEFGIVH